MGLFGEFAVVVELSEKNPHHVGTEATVGFVVVVVGEVRAFAGKVDLVGERDND